MLRMVTTATLVAYILYTIEAPSILLGRGRISRCSPVPFVLYGLFRYLYLIHVKVKGARHEVLLNRLSASNSHSPLGSTFVFILYFAPAAR